MRLRRLPFRTCPLRSNVARIRPEWSELDRNVLASADAMCQAKYNMDWHDTAAGQRFSFCVSLERRGPATRLGRDLLQVFEDEKHPWLFRRTHFSVFQETSFNSSARQSGTRWEEICQGASSHLL